MFTSIHCSKKVSLFSYFGNNSQLCQNFIKIFLKESFTYLQVTDRPIFGQEAIAMVADDNLTLVLNNL